MLADLDALRTTLGTVSNANNASLEWALGAARQNVVERVYPAKWLDDDTQYAVVLKSARLYKARYQSEGTAGWVDTGIQHVIADDPIEAGLLEHKLDMTKCGVA